VGFVLVPVGHRGDVVRALEEALRARADLLDLDPQGLREPDRVRDVEAVQAASV
jgi:hypothetical protein